MENARKEFESELKLNRTSQRARAATGKSLFDLRNDYERLQSLRYERQQKEAEEKMLQHWRINNPDFREVNRENHSIGKFSRINKIMNKSPESPRVLTRMFKTIFKLSSMFLS